MAAAVRARPLSQAVRGACAAACRSQMVQTRDRRYVDVLRSDKDELRLSVTPPVCNVVVGLRVRIFKLEWEA
ncbi:hypothetical protein [Bradyrhizobium sp. HKCCYLR20261]|uniref:hypothetical protein n=1 Tax=Bradyrhizobium sp. HKCCYLR20261 TaxID=3420760 RepID=UPI003EBD3ED2